MSYNKTIGQEGLSGVSVSVDEPTGICNTLDHINITVPTVTMLDECVKFYENLGLHNGNRPKFGFHGAWLYLGDIPVVHLQVPLDEHGWYSDGAWLERNEEPAIDHVAFKAIKKNTGDLDIKKAMEKLSNDEIKFTHSVVPDIDLEQLFVYDPCGVKVEINFDVSEKRTNRIKFPDKPIWGNPGHQSDADVEVYSDVVKFDQ